MSFKSTIRSALSERKLSERSRAIWEKHARREHSSGQNLIEFAIGITILLILLSGSLDLGRAYLSFLALQDAAAEGALYASTAPLDESGVRSRVRETGQWPVDFSAFTDDQIVVDLLGFACAGHDLKVTVKMDFVMAAPFIGGRTLPLAAESIYTVLAPPC